ncbi:unnamed protein product [Somion occarium]
MKVDERPHLHPHWNTFSPNDGAGVEGAFTFETSIAHGHGYTYLLKDGNGEWKAWATFMMLVDLKGYEEVGPERGVYGGHTVAWSDVLAERRARIELDPQVLVVGGGQTCLMVAARFKQMNIPTLLIERNARIGDNWRKRYPTISLHTPKQHHQLLYAPFPLNWPLYTPRDKLADWMESYAINQDLLTWTSSSIRGRPIYNEDAGKWDVTIDHNGVTKEIHPAHIVLATGTLGTPIIPHLENRDKFRGEILHGIDFKGGQLYSGKKVIVVGAGSTAIDICQDLCVHKAASVTMIQRSSTCVISQAVAEVFIGRAFPPDVPCDINDFKVGSIPMGLRKKVLPGIQHMVDDMEKEMYAKLRKGGVALNSGPDGAGHSLLVYERLGGYWYDVGGADLVGSGEIKVKQGVEPVACTEDSLVFSDGSEVEADVVFMACGWTKIRDANKDLFGEEVIDGTKDVFGLDEEGESKGGYRPTGHPGLWFATGDFWMARHLSKPLGIQIKAIELELSHNRR